MCLLRVAGSARGGPYGGETAVYLLSFFNGGLQVIIFQLFQDQLL